MRRVCPGTLVHSEQTIRSRPCAAALRDTSDVGGYVEFFYKLSFWAAIIVGGAFAFSPVSPLAVVWRCRLTPDSTQVDPRLTPDVYGYRVRCICICGHLRTHTGSYVYGYRVRCGVAD